MTVSDVQVAADLLAVQLSDLTADRESADDAISAEVEAISAALVDLAVRWRALGVAHREAVKMSETEFFHARQLGVTARGSAVDILPPRLRLVRSFTPASRVLVDLVDGLGRLADVAP